MTLGSTIAVSEACRYWDRVRTSSRFLSARRRNSSFLLLTIPMALSGSAFFAMISRLKYDTSTSRFEPRPRPLRESFAGLLRCPACRGPLALRVIERGADGEIETGQLSCANCAVHYAIRRSIPRFIDSNNYTASFGLQ